MPSSEFLLSSGFCFLSVSLLSPFRDCLFYLALKVLPGEGHTGNALYCVVRHGAHPFPTFRSKGSWYGIIFPGVLGEAGPMASHLSYFFLLINFHKWFYLS